MRDDSLLEKTARDFIWTGFLRSTYHLNESQIDLVVEDCLSSDSSGNFDPNPYFDVDFYKQQNAVQLREAQLSPLKHYLLHGAALGLLPNPMFGSPFQDFSQFSEYEKTHPEIAPLFKELFIGTIRFIEPYMLRPSHLDHRTGRELADSENVAIVIPVFNNWLWTERCLRAIHLSLGAVRPSIYVFDDGSSDATAQALSTQFPSVNVIRNDSNQGFLASCNLVFEQLRDSYDFVVLLNNDTEPVPGFLDELLDVLEKDPSTAIAGSRLVYPNGDLQEAGGIIWRDASGWNFGRNQAHGLDLIVQRNVDYISGASIMIRTSTIVGPLFDPLFLPAYYEDTDLAFSLRQRGYKVVYVPFSVVVHHEGKSHGTDLNSGVKTFQTENAFKFAKKWQGALRDHLHADPLSVSRAAFRLEKSAATNVLLWVDYQLPDPTKDSGSVRTVSLIRLLRELGFFIVFVPYNGDVRILNPYFVARLGAVVKKSISSAFSFLKTLELIPDFVMISRVSVAEGVFAKLRNTYPSAKIIFDTVDLHFLRVGRSAANSSNTSLAYQAEVMKEKELQIARDSDVTLVVSQFEKAMLLDLDSTLKVNVVSNIHSISPQEVIQSQRKGMVFVGSFNHHPNEEGLSWFFDHVWGALSEQSRGEGLTIIGVNPPAWLTGLEDKNVSVLGWVSDSSAYVRSSKVSIAPLTVGAGVKGKVGEAIACMTPVVGTSIATEGMHLTDGISCMIRDNPIDFALAVDELMRDERLRKNIATEAARVLGAHFSPDQAKYSLVKALGL